MAAVLHVASQLHGSAAGVYTRLPHRTANGYPVWRCDATAYVLYSSRGAAAAWCVADRDDGVLPGAAVARSVNGHAGRAPEECGVWEYMSPTVGWALDPSFGVTAVEASQPQLPLGLLCVNVDAAATGGCAIAAEAAAVLTPHRPQRYPMPSPERAYPTLSPPVAPRAAPEVASPTGAIAALRAEIFGAAGASRLHHVRPMFPVAAAPLSQTRGAAPAEDMVPLLFSPKAQEVYAQVYRQPPPAEPEESSPTRTVDTAPVRSAQEEGLQPQEGGGVPRQDTEAQTALTAQTTLTRTETTELKVPSSRGSDDAMEWTARSGGNGDEGRMERSMHLLSSFVQKAVEGSDPECLDATLRAKLPPADGGMDRSMHRLSSFMKRVASLPEQIHAADDNAVECLDATLHAKPRANAADSFSQRICSDEAELVMGSSLLRRSFATPAQPAATSSSSSSTSHPTAPLSEAERALQEQKETLANLEEECGALRARCLRAAKPDAGSDGRPHSHAPQPPSPHSHPSCNQTIEMDLSQSLCATPAAVANPPGFKSLAGSARGRREYVQLGLDEGEPAGSLQRRVCSPPGLRREGKRDSLARLPLAEATASDDADAPLRLFVDAPSRSPLASPAAEPGKGVRLVPPPPPTTPALGRAAPQGFTSGHTAAAEHPEGDQPWWRDFPSKPPPQYRVGPASPRESPPPMQDVSSVWQGAAKMDASNTTLQPREWWTEAGGNPPPPWRGSSPGAPPRPRVPHPTVNADQHDAKYSVLMMQYEDLLCDYQQLVREAPARRPESSACRPAHGAPHPTVNPDHHEAKYAHLAQQYQDLLADYKLLQERAAPPVSATTMPTNQGSDLRRSPSPWDESSVARKRALTSTPQRGDEAARGLPLFVPDDRVGPTRTPPPPASPDDPHITALTQQYRELAEEVRALRGVQTMPIQTPAANARDTSTSVAAAAAASPGLVVRFDSAVSRVMQRAGQAAAGSGLSTLGIVVAVLGWFAAFIVAVMK